MVISNEIWVDAVGFEGYYAVSNLGRVKRVARKRNSRFYPERLLKPWLSRYGYYECVFMVNRVRYKQLLHRVIAMAFIPNPEDKPQINHKNGVRDDFSISNLEWCTALENQRHRIEVLKNDNIGENHPKAKLSGIDVSNILEMYSSGEYTMKKIGDIYKVLPTTIFKIIHKITWAKK